VSREPLPSPSHAGLDYVEAEDRRTIAALGLRLTFFRVGERWSHSLEVGEGTGPILADGLAEVVESDPDRDDRSRVVSPTYQDVQEHPLPGGIRLLLTGQSTPHHFSAVVTARRDAAGVTIEFDVADRCREPVTTLGAMYLVRLGSSELIDAGTDRVAWEGETLGAGRLQFAADDPASVSLAEAGRRAARVQALARIVPTERTQRLLYRWRWSPSAPPDTDR
jgi:hypothetical protein